MEELQAVVTQNKCSKVKINRQKKTATVRFVLARFEQFESWIRIDVSYSYAKNPGFDSSSKNASFWTNTLMAFAQKTKSGCG